MSHEFDLLTRTMALIDKVLAENPRAKERMNMLITNDYEPGRCQGCGNWLPIGGDHWRRQECEGCQATRMAWESRLDREHQEQRWAESEKEM